MSRDVQLSANLVANVSSDASVWNPREAEAVWEEDLVLCSPEVTQPSCSVWEFVSVWSVTQHSPTSIGPASPNLTGYTQQLQQNEHKLRNITGSHDSPRHLIFCVEP